MGIIQLFNVFANSRFHLRMQKLRYLQTPKIFLLPTGNFVAPNGYAARSFAA